MHGFIWDDENDTLEKWNNGYTYEGNYMSEKAITYTTKYMLKINEQDKLYIPKIMCSAGIGEKWTKGIGPKYREPRLPIFSTPKLYFSDSACAEPSTWKYSKSSKIAPASAEHTTQLAPPLNVALWI